MWALSSLNLTSSPLNGLNLPSLRHHATWKCIPNGIWGSKTEDWLVKHHTNCKTIRLFQYKDSSILYGNEGIQNKLLQEHEDDSTRDQGFENLILQIKEMLNTMDDGRISISPYDTAWIAHIKNIDGSETPQFPSSLNWIAENQLPDGSWGDADMFSIYDRLINTLACVIALKSWSIHADKSAKGISFVKENICKLESANVENMTCGFEVIFPALLERARKLGIELSCRTAPYMKDICATRDLKMARIPKDVMHTVPTSLLFSLEGLSDLRWQKLLKLKNLDGSFLTSPSSTAFAFIETKDERCFNFLKDVTAKFNGGAPTTYPVDLFARVFAVDRLQRLGISRYFSSEIDECLDFVYRFWTENGIFSGRGSMFCDIDDTSMAFRLLRLQGYNMNPNVFKNFKKDGNFCCYPGQIMESATPIFNLYRASQVLYRGEKILEEAKEFAYNFLQNWIASNQVLDKWVIAKDFPGEVRYALEVPWYANLPRVEARLYIEKYGGANDVWIAKTLYRMPDINNNVYHELAEKDFNKCQAQHQVEWRDIQQWYTKHNIFGDFKISKKHLLHAFFVAAASIFELERSKERLAWAKSLIFFEMIKTFFNTTSLEEKKLFLMEFKNHVHGKRTTYRSRRHRLLRNLAEFLHELSMDAMKELGRDIRPRLHDAWDRWLALNTRTATQCGEEAELLVHTINLCAGRMASNEIESQLEYSRLSSLTNKICHQLQEFKNKKVFAGSGNGCLKQIDVEADMQGLVRLVLENSVGIPRDMKNTFLAVAKAFYYTAYFTEETIDFHVCKVLFQPIV